MNSSYYFLKNNKEYYNQIKFIEKLLKLKK